MIKSSYIVLDHPARGFSPSGFNRVHVEMSPREVIRLIGYDPRTLTMKPRKTKTARGTRDLVPHNVPMEIVTLQNQVQRSIDANRVATMVDYLLGAMERSEFADWGAIELVTSTEPDFDDFETKHEIRVDSDADYFISDGQHRYCALLDFMRQYPQHADRFTQEITISILPPEKLAEWAGQEFHDRNYFSVPVRPGKALAVDTRDPVNALAKEASTHSTIETAGGIAYERDTLLTGDHRFTSHAQMHRFVKGFLFGRPGLDKGVDTRIEISAEAQGALWHWIASLGEFLPWKGDGERDSYLTRSGAVLAGLAVIGHDLFEKGAKPEQYTEAARKLGSLDWRRSNLGLVGVVGSEKNSLVQPGSSRQTIDATIRYMREKLGMLKP